MANYVEIARRALEKYRADEERTENPEDSRSQAENAAVDIPPDAKDFVEIEI